ALQRLPPAPRAYAPCFMLPSAPRTGSTIGSPKSALRRAISFATSHGCISAIEFHFDCAPLSVALAVGGSIRQRVLMTQLFHNSRECVTQSLPARSGYVRAARFSSKVF